MTKMESVQGKNKSTAYLQDCSVQEGVRFNSVVILMLYLTLNRAALTLL